MHADAPTPNQPPRQHVPAVERAVGALGALLLASAVAFLALEAARGPGRPPDVVVAVDTVAAGRGGWLVRVRARNLGDETAAEVRLRGTLSGAGGEPVERETTIDYLPGRSEREAGLVFPTDPSAGTLRLEVVGHRPP